MFEIVYNTLAAPNLWTVVSFDGYGRICICTTEEQAKKIMNALNHECNKPNG